jgi:peptidoglycan/LPS O-acetylase OafA/YrhL
MTAGCERAAVIPRLRERLDQARIPSLDGIRAIAVFLVILYHFGFGRINGGLGVEMFFTLSGFLITWSLLRENAKTGRISFRAFYKRRTLRIFPAFYVFWLFGLIVYLARGHQIPWPSVAASAAYLENYRAGLKSGESNFLSHTWSLGIEEQFYLVWPLLFAELRDKLKRLAWVLGGVIVFVWAYRAALHFGLSVWQGYIYNAFETRMDQLAVGCLLAVVLFRGSFERVWRAVTISPMLIPIVLGLIMLSGAFHHHFGYRHTVGYALEPVMVAILIVQVIYFADRWPGKLLNSPPVSYLGRVSYSLYLYQALTLYTARQLTAALPLAVQLLFAIFVTVVFAAVSYHLVEQRFRFLGQWLFGVGDSAQTIRIRPAIARPPASR